jgi:hypothetical protein
MCPTDSHGWVTVLVAHNSVIVKLTWDEKRKKDYEGTFHPLEKKMEGLASRYTHKEVLLFIEFVQKTTEFLHEETSRLSEPNIEL